MIGIMKQGLGQARPNKTAFVKQRTPQWGFQATERSCAARWRGLAPASSCGRTTRNGKQAKAGYHHDGGTLPFALHPPILCVSGQSRRTSVHGRYARTQEKGQVLAYRGVLSAVGMVYSV